MKIYGIELNSLQVRNYANREWGNVISVDDIIAIIRDDNRIFVYESSKNGIFKNVILYEDSIKASTLTGDFMYSFNGSYFV